MVVKKTARKLPTRASIAPKSVLERFKKRFRPKKIGNGTYRIDLDSWKQFSNVIQERGLTRNSLVYRGHSCARWSLDPSLYRNVEDPKRAARLTELQLSEFKMAARGRCQASASELDDHWWALGQHMGLRTPLLDWSSSPYVGLFFAFADTDDHEDTENRAVFVLDRNLIDRRCNQLRDEDEAEEELIRFVEPFSHENTRIVGQAGLFTLSPPGWSIEEWVNYEFDEQSEKLALIKILIPEKDRANCLRHLNRMNINYLSLFPDIEGSAKHCNLRREIRGY